MTQTRPKLTACACAIAVSELTKDIYLEIWLSGFHSSGELKKRFPCLDMNRSEMVKLSCWVSDAKRAEEIIGNTVGTTHIGA